MNSNKYAAEAIGTFWLTFAGDGHTAIEASNFVAYIGQDHADLLSFESSDSEPDTVRRWLQDAGLIK